MPAGLFDPEDAVRQRERPRGQPCAALALALQQGPLQVAPAVVDMIAMDAGGGRREVVN